MLQEFDPECYSICIRKVFDEEDGVLYEATVKEVRGFIWLAKTYQEAYSTTLEILKDLKELREDIDLFMPKPYREDGDGD